MEVYRGQRVRFTAEFEGSPQAGFPKFEVKDPLGKLVAAGTGSPDNALPNVYFAEVVIPLDAYVGDNWNIHWWFEGINGEQKEFTQDFSVVDFTLAESDTRAQQSIALVGRPFRTFIRFMEPPASLKLTVLNPETDEPLPSTNPNGYTYPGDLREVRDLDTYVYVFESQLSEPGSCVLLWEYMASPVSGPYFQYEMLHVIPLTLVPKFTELRILIDKFQKKFGSRRAYEDAELLEYLMRGLDLVNQHHPLTDWTVYTIPKSLETYWIMYSAWYALNAQYLLEGDAMFDYSGLSVTLSVDRTGYVESELERLKTYLDEKLTQTKLAILRRQHAGAVLGRGMYPIQQFRFVGTWRRPRLISINY